MGELSPNPPEDRLDSWKEIAAYLRRDVTTVQRWEKREGMPVHRHLHDRLGSVYAFRTELDAWATSRRHGLGPGGRVSEDGGAEGRETAENRDMEHSVDAADVGVAPPGREPRQGASP